ncbi:hypothetical protein BpHYR1_036603 [Brachionus plicatilis]|uniref:Uncharacterized protein n=1 Tax=Brachionus plicatilis TaxID=10195 RepID=A0A3M7T390_BRAPC|nr:hypothetical protein BpHYR1_036603 [Brachionus plicatilis]
MKKLWACLFLLASSCLWSRFECFSVQRIYTELSISIVAQCLTLQNSDIWQIYCIRQPEDI